MKQPILSDMKPLQRAASLNSFIQVRTGNTVAGLLFVPKNSTAANGFRRARPYVVRAAAVPGIADPGSSYRRRHQ